MMDNLWTHICITWPQWVNIYYHSGMCWRDHLVKDKILECLQENICILIVVLLKYTEPFPKGFSLSYIFNLKSCIQKLITEKSPQLNLPNVALWLCMGSLYWVNTLRPRQNGCHFADDTFKCIFLNEKKLEFRCKFHWSLFLRVQLTIFQHWFR